MNDREQQTVTLDEYCKRRTTVAAKFAQIGERVARALPAVREPAAGVASLPAADAHTIADEQDTEWYDVVPRFPLVRSGYECEAVEEHIAMLEGELADLEQELEQLRTRPAVHDEVEAEIRRIGEETSSILIAAHDRARETARKAQEQADRCIADAASNAIAITEEANRERAAVQEEMRKLAGQRARLLADLEGLAGTLATVAREASARSEAV